MEQIPTDYNGFIEKAVAAANEHQKGAYDWQAEKRKSFIEGASYGYQFYASLCEWKEKQLKEVSKALNEMTGDWLQKGRRITELEKECEGKEKEIAELKKECLRLGELFQGTNKF